MSDSTPSPRGAPGKSKAQLQREQREREKAMTGEGTSSQRAGSSSRERTSKKEPTKSKAQLQREERELAEAVEEQEASEVEQMRSMFTKVEKKEKEAKKPKAVLQREQREAEQAEEEERLAKESAAKARRDAERKANEPPPDKRSAAQKHREEREIDKSSGGTGLSGPSWAASAAADYVTNSKSKTKSSIDAKDGLSLFDDLASEEDPVEVAEWFLREMQKVTKGKDGVESLPLYKFACAVNSATEKQRQVVAKAAIEGYGAMEPERRAQILNLVVKSADAASPGASKSDSNHVTNLRTIVKAARLDKMPEDDRRDLMMTVQSQALQFATPQHLAEGLAHLSKDERKELAAALTKTKLIPEDQQAFVQEIVQPDGILEEAGTAASTVNDAREFLWFFVALPFMEYFCAKRWLRYKQDCAANLNSWMHADACLALATVMFAAFAWKLLGPAYDVLSSDPVGSMRRWQKSATSGTDLSERLLQTFRIDSVSFRFGCVSVVVVLLATLFSAVYAVWGVLHFIGVVLDACIEISALFISAVLAFRFCLIAYIVYMIVRVWKLMTRHKLVAIDAGLGYGSFNDDSSGSDKV
mmetsp:Transcript_124519/g.195099  ORF Transcript_124519/g.195099 Transcript_124519/m.195099 type:complete len:586 (+) Transcript_124519:130-1887(+)